MHIINVWNYIQRFASKPLTAANGELWTSEFWDVDENEKQRPRTTVDSGSY